MHIKNYKHFIYHIRYCTFYMTLAFVNFFRDQLSLFDTGFDHRFATKKLSVLLFATNCGMSLDLRLYLAPMGVIILFAGAVVVLSIESAPQLWILGLYTHRIIVSFYLYPRKVCITWRT